MKLSVFSGRRPEFDQWLFRDHQQDPFLKKKRKLSLNLVQLNQGHNCTVRISRSPGILAVWSGVLLVLAGMCLRYFFSYRVVWASVDGNGSVSQVVIAGEAARHHIHFPLYFNQMVKTLKNKKGRV